MREKYKWTQEKDFLLKRGFEEKKTYKEIMDLYIQDATKEQIKARSLNLGLKKVLNKKITNRKYACNLNYFQTPNYMNSFIAGWLSADGCIHVRLKEFYDLSWQMESIDREFLEIFKKDINYNGPIYEIFSHGVKYINKDGENHSCLRINSIGKMAEDLDKNFGIIPNKTYRLGPPAIKQIELKLAYLVGFINGDGCIALDKKKSCGLSIRFQGAGHELIKWCRELFLSMGIKTPRNRIPSLLTPENSKACRLFIISGIAALRMYELLKLVPVPILARKWIRPEIDAHIAEKKLKHPEYFEESIESILRRNDIDFSRAF